MARCLLCKRSLFKCRCHSAPGQVKNKKTGTTTDRNGIEWCGACSSRVMNGRCTNTTCSTRK